MSGKTAERTPAENSTVRAPAGSVARTFIHFDSISLPYSIRAPRASSSSSSSDSSVIRDTWTLTLPLTPCFRAKADRSASTLLLYPRCLSALIVRYKFDRRGKLSAISFREVFRLLKRKPRSSSPVPPVCNGGDQIADGVMKIQARMHKTGYRLSWGVKHR